VWLLVHSHAACYAGVEVAYRLVETPARLVVDLAFPRERQLGHFHGQAQTEYTLCTTRRDEHSGVGWDTVTAEIGIESDMPIVQP
jgi:hypothetical protein